MKKVAIVLVFSVILPFQVDADELNANTALNTLGRQLMDWIDANSNYRTKNLPLPDIVEMNRVQLTKEVYVDHPQLLPASRIDDRINALYNFDKGPHGTIYVLAARLTDDGAAPDEPPQSDPVFQEHVLHELVHHVQRLSGAYATFPCRKFGEREAYEFGGKFLKANNSRDPLPNRIFWSRVYSRC